MPAVYRRTGRRSIASVGAWGIVLPSMVEPAGVIVIGAGQAGLATSHELTRAGLEHVVLEGGRVGESWRGRWDSFCLVTPNWTVQLPGGAYDGGDPDGYIGVMTGPSDIPARAHLETRWRNGTRMHV